VTISVGHCHDRIVKAATNQLEKLMHATTLYLNPEITLYAKELSDKLPGDLNVVYFVNSGSEATDLAMLMARLTTGNEEIIALKNAYHGMSQGAMGVTSFSTWKYPGF
jgi:alanine-glyoxylate transaminase / (R)-3-amino-2-methylpropionate-pyruvate transaminase